MNRISFWAPDHARTATQLQTDVAHAKAGRKANPAAMNVQRNWRCAVKGCYLLLPAAPMPQQYSRLALAVRCDETAPGKGASRQNDANGQPLQARLWLKARNLEDADQSSGDLKGDDQEPNRVEIQAQGEQVPG